MKKVMRMQNENTVVYVKTLTSNKSWKKLSYLQNIKFTYEHEKENNTIFRWFIDYNNIEKMVDNIGNNIEKVVEENQLILTFSWNMLYTVESNQQKILKNTKKLF